MIVSSQPTAPSRLRSDQGRRGILCPEPGLLAKPARSSSAVNGSTRYGSGSSLWLTVIDHDCSPPLRTLNGRGFLRSALIAGEPVRKFSRSIKVARLARCPASQRKSFDRTGSGHSAQAAGTGAVAPWPPLRVLPSNGRGPGRKPTRPGATDAIIIMVDNPGLGPVRSRRPFSTAIGGEA